MRKKEKSLNSLGRKKAVIVKSLGSAWPEEICVSAITGYYKKFIRGHWAIQIALCIYSKRNL